jgi:carbon-monoxide dehydrogenase large subunit
VERTGSVTAITGSGPSGQGHETIFRQIVADSLGVDVDAIVVRLGDTRAGAPGFGTLGSRSTAVGGGALATAAVEVRDKARRIAARMLEIAVEDVVAARDGLAVRGAPHGRVTWAQVADLAYRGSPGPGETPGLEATAFFNPEGEAWGFGTVVVAVQIDPETGCIAIDRLVWVDDAGNLINPLLVEGQLHGSLAQGYGQAVLEEVVYDAAGQLLTGSLMDYAIPRAADVPVPVLGKTVTPSPRNPLGAKGVGEAGCIGVPPAIVNAVLDALAPFGVTRVDMPLTSEKIWTLLGRHADGTARR